MDSWKSLLLGFTFIALFSYAILSFGGLLQMNNNVNNSIFNEPIMKSFNDSLSTNLNDLQSNANAQANASDLEQGENQIPTGALILPSIFRSFGRFTGFLYGFGGALINMLGYLIQDPLITGVLFSVLIIVAVFTFWRFIKWGQ